MKLFDMKARHQEAMDAAQTVLATAERANRKMTPAEQSLFDSNMAEAADLSPRIEASMAVNTLAPQLTRNGFFPAPGQPSAQTSAFGTPLRLGEALSPEYARSLHAFLSTGGKAHDEELTAGADGAGGYHIPGSEMYTRQRRANGLFAPMNAATYEGTLGSSNSAGGYAVSVPTDQLIVPLGLPDLGIFDASMVVPTSTDVKIPQAASFGTSALKAESTGTIATFGGTDPSLGQVTLSAFMSGALRLCSWELIQDVEAFNAFIVDDLIKGQRILEGSLLASGTGTGQAQGVFGNTGTGTGTTYNLAGTAADSTTLLNSLFDVVSTLKGVYQANAVWVLARSTGLAIRRAQMQSNLFAAIATVDADGTERILGKPVFYDVNAPALPTTTTAGVLPILYGDFKAGYVVGVRGGAGINIKILDQPWANQGQLGILAYRRLDGRVRRSEAIQSVKISHT